MISQQHTPRMRAAQQQAPPTERVSEFIARLKEAAADPDSPVDLTQASPSLSESSPPTPWGAEPLPEPSGAGFADMKLGHFGWDT